MNLPTLHLIGVFHTQATDDYSHCAFTGKARRFPLMMRRQGWRVVEYGNAGSQAQPDQFVPMLSLEQFETLYGNRRATAFHGDDATIGSPGHEIFESRLLPELESRLKPQDIICHPFGHAHQSVVEKFPAHQHVETGIGYPTLMPGTFRVFESYAWMHYHQGREGRNGISYEWVVPNYYDLDDWDVQASPGDYLAFLGRICPEKGMDTILAIADHSPWPIVIAGQGDPTPWRHPNIQYRGPITGRDRSAFLGGARAALMPSFFTEPFGGSGVEAMLCGTPLIAVDYGAFAETVIPSITGFRCRTLHDWLEAISSAACLNRGFIAKIARNRYGLDACGKQYDRLFRQIHDLWGAGWYALSSNDVIDFDRIEQEEAPFAARLAKWIADTLKPQCVNDLGCGPGTYVEALRSHGLNAVGYDVDERIEGKEHLIRRSLIDVDSPAEVTICLEVAEHIDSRWADEVVRSAVCNTAPGGTLIWTAAQPGQQGEGHVNCQPKAYWEEKLQNAGMVLDPELQGELLQYAKSGEHMGWFTQNLLVLRRPVDASVLPRTMMSMSSARQ